MRARCAVATLLVLALSAALFCAPAGSATRAQVATAGEQVQTQPSFREDPSGSGTSSGDDDRWGNTGTNGTPPAPRIVSGGGHDTAPHVSVPMFGVQVEVRLVPGVVLFIVTMR